MKNPNPNFTPPQRNPYLELLADEAANEAAKSERFARDAERAEERRRAALPPPPPPPPPVPKKIRLTSACMVGGRLAKPGDVFDVLEKPVWPAGTLPTDTAKDLVTKGRAEAAE
jgi:hypothetical protein